MTYTTEGHELTWTAGKGDRNSYRPPAGRCACGLFSMIGPQDLVETFHSYHVRFPDVTVRGAVNR